MGYRPGLFLARACCEMGYLTEEEAWSYIDKAYDMAHKEFTSWKEFAMSYVIGRSLWGGRKAYNSIIKNRADELLSDEKAHGFVIHGKGCAIHLHTTSHPIISTCKTYLVRSIADGM